MSERTEGRTGRRETAEGQAGAEGQGTAEGQAGAEGQGAGPPEASGPPPPRAMPELSGRRFDRFSERAKRSLGSPRKRDGC